MGTWLRSDGCECVLRVAERDIDAFRDVMENLWGHSCDNDLFGDEGDGTLRVYLNEQPWFCCWVGWCYGDDIDAVLGACLPGSYIDVVCEDAEGVIERHMVCKDGIVRTEFREILSPFDGERAAVDAAETRRACLAICSTLRDVYESSGIVSRAEALARLSNESLGLARALSRRLGFEDDAADAAGEAWDVEW